MQLPQPLPLPSPAGRHRRRRRNSWQLWENFSQVAINIGNFSQMDYINTSHPNFVGGSKALEIALEQIKSSRLPISMSRTKGARPVADIERPGSADKSGNNSNGTWGFSSIFGGNASAKENSLRKTHGDPIHSMEHTLSMIQLKEVNHTKRELHDVFIRKLYRLLKSYQLKLKLLQKVTVQALIQLGCRRTMGFVHPSMQQAVILVHLT